MLINLATVSHEASRGTRGTESARRLALAPRGPLARACDPAASTRGMMGRRSTRRGGSSEDVSDDRGGGGGGQRRRLAPSPRGDRSAPPPTRRARCPGRVAAPGSVRVARGAGTPRSTRGDAVDAIAPRAARAARASRSIPHRSDWDGGEAGGIPFRVVGSPRKSSSALTPETGEWDEGRRTSEARESACGDERRFSSGFATLSAASSRGGVRDRDRERRAFQRIRRNRTSLQAWIRVSANDHHRFRGVFL